MRVLAIFASDRNFGRKYCKQERYNGIFDVYIHTERAYKYVMGALGVLGILGPLPGPPPNGEGMPDGGGNLWKSA